MGGGKAGLKPDKSGDDAGVEQALALLPNTVFSSAEVGRGSNVNRQPTSTLRLYVLDHHAVMFGCSCTCRNFAARMASLSSS